MIDSKSLLKNLHNEIVSFFLPSNIFRQKMSYDKDRGALNIKNKRVNLKRKNIFVFSTGKSSLEMAEATNEILGERIKKGLAITNIKAKKKNIGNIEIAYGNHPLPDENSLKSGKKIHRMISMTGQNDVVIFLISGGGSDMMVYPENSISLKDYIKTVKILKKCGADIGEINTIRKKIDRVKGGKLRLASKSDKFINIVFSDVPTLNDDLKFIASGPVFKDDTEFKDAYNIFLKYRIENEIPESVRDFIKKNINKKTKVDENVFKNDITFLMAKNRDVQRFIGDYLNEKGFKVIFLKRMVKYEVNKEKDYLLRKIFENINKKNIAIIGGGEPVVKIDVKSPGKGGRMSHLSLLILRELLKNKIKNVSFLLAGTDGIDGNSRIAGAIVSMRSLGKIKLNEVERYLKNYDSASFLKKYRLALETGYTGINLADILVFLIG